MGDTAAKDANSNQNRGLDLLFWGFSATPPCDQTCGKVGTESAEPGDSWVRSVQAIRGCQRMVGRWDALPISPPAPSISVDSYLHSATVRLTQVLGIVSAQPISQSTSLQPISPQIRCDPAAFSIVPVHRPLSHPSATLPRSQRISVGIVRVRRSCS